MTCGNGDVGVRHLDPIARIGEGDKRDVIASRIEWGRSVFSMHLLMNRR